VDIAARFGKNIARCRRRAGLSQEELSIRASLHRTEISQLERGLRLARIDTLVKLAGALGVSTDNLVEGIDWQPGSATIGEFSVAAAEAEPSAR
jgi:transcriptional regulator with XRE-family HTH domain